MRHFPFPGKIFLYYISKPSLLLLSFFGIQRKSGYGLPAIALPGRPFSLEKKPKLLNLYPLLEQKDVMSDYSGLILELTEGGSVCSRNYIITDDVRKKLY